MEYLEHNYCEECNVWQAVKKGVSLVLTYQVCDKYEQFNVKEDYEIVLKVLSLVKMRGTSEVKKNILD